MAQIQLPTFLMTVLCVGLQFVIYASLLNLLFHPQTVGILLYLVGLYFSRNSVLYDDEDKTEDKNKVLDTEDNTERDEDENKVTLLSVSYKPNNEEETEHVLFNKENTTI